MVILVFFLAMAISVNRWLFRYFGSYSGFEPVFSLTFQAVTLNSEMDFYLRNGRNGDFLYEMESQNSILFII